MYYKLNNIEFKKIKKAEKITFTDYELIGDFIPVENMIGAIENLLLEINRLEDEKKDREQEIEDNFKPIPVREQYGISDRDFM